MSEHIQIEAVGLPHDSIKELEAPSLLDNEKPFRQYIQNTWSGKTTALHFYKSGLIKISRSGKKHSPVLIRPGLLDANPLHQYYVPPIFVWLSIAAVVASGVLYYLSIFNEWMFSFCLILALALVVTQTTYRIAFTTSGAHCNLFNLQCWFIHKQQILELADLIKTMTSDCKSQNTSLPQKVQEHRRLFNEGLLAEAEYETAKAKLFAKGH